MALAAHEGQSFGLEYIKAEAEHLNTNSFHTVTHAENRLADADWQNELCHGISRIIWQLMSWLKGKIFITFVLDDF